VEGVICFFSELVLLDLIDYTSYIFIYSLLLYYIISLEMQRSNTDHMNILMFANVNNCITADIVDKG
jgi:hypothetical protein